MRPRSSTSVLRPFSVSSFAAQPPLIPEPTTIASNEFCSMLDLNPSGAGPGNRENSAMLSDSIVRSFPGFPARHRHPRGRIMDSLRVLLVPFHPTNLVMAGIFGVLLTFCLSAGFYGLFAAFFLLIWVFKYCYALIEHLADGA